MKFDRIMEHCFRVFCIVTAFTIFVAAVTSCVGGTISVGAVEISAESDYSEYLSAYGQNLNGIDFQLSNDEDGNRNVRLKIFGMQQALLEDQTNIFNSIDWGSPPEAVDISYSGLTALYYNPENVVKPVSLHLVENKNYKGNNIFISSPEFNFIFDYSGDGSDTYSFYYYNTDGNNINYDFNFNAFYTGSARYGFQTLNNLYTSYIRNFSAPASMSQTYIIHTDHIPKFNGVGTLSGNIVVGGLGQQTNLITDIIDTNTPWEYYNDTFLPYIHENYGYDYDEYLVFPDGYQLPVVPTEPPMIPPIVDGGGVVVGGIFAPIILGAGAILDLGGLNLDVFAPIDGLIRLDGIDIQFPLDDSDNRVVINNRYFPVPSAEPFEIDGHIFNFDDLFHFEFDGISFIRNPDNTLTIEDTDYNYPIGTPEITPSEAYDMVYEYQIPTIENINVVDARLEAPELDEFANVTNFLWACITRVLNDSGMMPFVMVAISISAVSFVLWKVGK